MTTEQSTSSKQKQAPKRRRRWRRRILTVLFLAVLLIVLAPLALALGPVRTWVANKVGDQIGRRVEIGSASAFWFKGIDLEDITVHSPQGFDRPLATVEKLHADLDIVGLLRGKGGASIHITKPHLTLLRDAQGRGNADGVLESMQAGPTAGEPASKPDTEATKGNDTSAGTMRFKLVVVDGRVEAAGRAGETPRAIRDIQVTLEQTPDDPTRMSVTGRLEGMSASGGDVEIRASAAMADGSTPFEFSLSEAIDLAKLAPIAEGAAAVEGLRGTLHIDVKGTATSDGRLDGRGTIKGAGIALNSPGGLKAFVGSIDLTTTFDRVDSGTKTSANGTLRDLRLEQAREDGPPVSMNEPLVTLAVEATQSADGNRIAVENVAVAAGATLNVTLTQPIELTLGDRWTAKGTVGVRADLSKLGALQSIVPQVSELRGGAFSAQVRATTSADGATQVGAGLRIDNLRLDPGSLFEAGYTEPRIDAQIVVKQPQDAPTQIEIRSLTLSGISSNGAFALGDDETNGSLTTTIDLASARLVPAYLALEAGTRLGGRLVATTRVAKQALSTRIRGDVQGTNISWSQPGQRPWSEPTLRVDHDITMPSAEGIGTLHDLRASLGSLRVDASGSTWSSEPESRVDAKVALSGQSERIVSLLEAARGEAFQDVRASGAVSGTITVRGPATKADVVVSGTVDAGTWESGGFVLAGVKVTLDRPQPGTPLKTKVTATLNGGQVSLDTGLRLSEREEIPWDLTLSMQGVDTSNVLVSKGAGRYMSFLLPSLVPAGSQVPVMSGKLDASATLSAQDISGDVLVETVQGNTTIRMVQGEIRNSTLFGVGGGSPQMNQLMDVLGSAAPDVRSTLASVSKALVFSSLDSRARIAQRIVTIDALDLMGPYVKVSSTGTANMATDRLAMQTKVELLGSAGEKVGKILPDRTIPLQVTGPLGSPQVTPRVDPAKLVQGGLAKEGKKLLEGLTGGKGKQKNPLDKVKDLFGK